MYQNAKFEPSASESSAPAERARADELVNRYPNLRKTEIALLVDAYRSLSPVELALMHSDANLGPKRERFLRDHRGEVRAPFSHISHS